MKKQIILSLMLFMFLAFSVKAGDNPKNIVSINMPNLGLYANKIGGNIPLSYERVLTDHFSATLHLKFGLPRNLGNSSLMSNFTGDYGDSTYGNPYTDMRYAGFSIMPEFKFYTSGEKGAPKGFYVSVYFKYTSYTVKSTYEDYFADNNGVTLLSAVDLTGKYQPLGGGIALGYQWLIRDRVSIDWTFIGLGIGRLKTSVEMTTDDPRVSSQSIKSSAEEISVNTNSDFLKTEVTATDNSAKITIKNMWPMLRVFGVRVGFAF